MNFYNRLQLAIHKEIEALSRSGELPDGLDCGRVSVEPARDPAHGDVATNAAMVLAKSCAMKPRELAERIAGRLRGHHGIEAVEVAGPGFINIRLAAAFWYERLAEILEAGTAYGDCGIGRGEKVNVEYVSANPTGPLHIGHGRGAVFGDALAALLEKAGFDVTREYYVNDAGVQIDILVKTTVARAEEAAGIRTISEGDLEGLYPGEYLKPIGEKLSKRYGYEWIRDTSEEEKTKIFVKDTVDEMMALIRADLAALGIKFDVYTSERELVAEGRIDAAVKFLEERGLVYTGVLEPPKGKTPDDWEPRPQLLFRASDFGDDVDRPLKKSDGSWTYFATDIAYHLDKFRRGFSTMIDVWGADHGGYVKRVRAAVEALTEGKGEIDVKICQLVHLLEKGEPVKMSKRGGTFVSLRDVLDGLAGKIGKDGARHAKNIVRFIMLTRKNDAALDFDLAKVTEESRDNPVFYVQYAHARCQSVLRLAGEEFPDLDSSARALAGVSLRRLTDESEIALIKLLSTWPRLVEGAAEAHEPHRCAFFLYDVAGAFHSLWNKGKEEAHLRFLVPGDRELTAARLALVRAVAVVIASGLEIFGVEPVEELR